MNSLKNLRQTLSPILRRSGAVRPKPTPPPPKPSTRCYHTLPRRPEALQPSRGLFRRVSNPVVNRPPAPALPRHYSSLGSHVQRWYWDQWVLYATLAAIGSVAITLQYGTFESVPYSNRTHFIIITPEEERSRGEKEFNRMKKKLAKKIKILPPDHPDTVRVKGLVTEIVSAAHRGLGCRAGDASYGGISSGDDSWREDSATHETEAADAARRGKEVLKDKSISVAESRNRWKGQRAPLQTKHLEGLKWEVIVVKDNDVNATCLPGGKIIVHTGFLDNFKTDAEVATVLGHEVGHVIARHVAEKITKNMWIMILKYFVYLFCEAPVGSMDNMSSLLLWLPFSRRMELEADHIGILLLGAAGFDPHIAPSVYKKLGKINGDSRFFDFISTHPSSTKRAQLLSEHMVMEEAMDLYTEASAGEETKGFF